MNLTGQNFIGNEKSAKGKLTFNAVNPATTKEIEPLFYEATLDEVNLAVNKADEAFKVYRKKSGKEKAEFLEAIAEEILALGDELILRCVQKPDCRKQE